MAASSDDDAFPRTLSVYTPFVRRGRPLTQFPNNVHTDKFHEIYFRTVSIYGTNRKARFNAATRKLCRTWLERGLNVLRARNTHAQIIRLKIGVSTLIFLSRQPASDPIGVTCRAQNSREEVPLLFTPT